ncbi:hypothetical protein HKBW3S33_02255 [Candidatus Hakubella thermalkaliphila]|uniref:Uncharacterized protein n=1 Tax=Candidatus Hakubella thermalkaliphila TaxID=2754717 RepID=A0A6V8P880_9ACTN|nr:hypothetical protein HKBW3S33_02255 [Candidatus Hakubella thermalkaliphila]
MDGAVPGLKAATLDHAKRASTGNTGVFSFENYRHLLNRPTAGKGPSILQTMKASGVMSSGEVARMDTILRHAEVIQRTITLRINAGTLVDAPDMLSNLVARLIGANIGGATGAAQGAPLVMAGAVSRAAQKIADKIPTTKIMDVFIEASNDPKFMANLLEKPQTVKRKRELHRQINAFLLQAGLVEREESQGE